MSAIGETLFKPPVDSRQTGLRFERSSWHGRNPEAPSLTFGSTGRARKTIGLANLPADFASGTHRILIGILFSKNWELEFQQGQVLLEDEYGRQHELGFDRAQWGDAVRASFNKEVEALCREVGGRLELEMLETAQDQPVARRRTEKTTRTGLPAVRRLLDRP